MFSYNLDISYLEELLIGMKIMQQKTPGLRPGIASKGPIFLLLSLNGLFLFTEEGAWAVFKSLSTPYCLLSL